MKIELTILIVWYNEKDVDRIACFEENKKSFFQYNPDAEIYIIMNPFENAKEAWLGTDLAIFLWYKENRKKLNTQRFLIVEWDCWCDINLKDYYGNVWNCDVVASSVLYPEKDNWYWFNTIDKLPMPARLYATGIVPSCGILISKKAMESICDEILKKEYRGLISELRFATIATMLGFDPVTNPSPNRTITWKSIAPFIDRYKGLHHPRKTLPVPSILKDILPLLNIKTEAIPKIIHQTWESKTIPKELILTIETWNSAHPNWKYIFWTDSMNREYIKDFFPQFLLQYDSYQKDVQRSDVVKYFILYKFGGVFIDTDIECLKSIDSLIDLNNSECIFNLECELYAKKLNQDYIISNSFMAAKPESKFILEVCQTLAERYIWKQNLTIINVLYSTGAMVLTESYKNFSNKSLIKLLSQDIIYSLSEKETELIRLGSLGSKLEKKIENSYAIRYGLQNPIRFLED